MNHELYIRRCFDLAKRGEGYVSPNPLVGCVIVHNNKVIGEGWHEKFGHAHAEVNAFASVMTENKSMLSESTVYVSLEPCCHFGKTPPCTQLIIQNKVKKVVISCLDPNPIVAGKGVQQLKNAGIEVEYGILEQEGRALIKSFIKNILFQRPYIYLKWAESKDGFISKTNEKTNISNPISNRLIHQLRSEMDGILVGSNTAIIDNPLLNNRLHFGKSSIPILIDRYQKVSPQSNILLNTNSIIITEDKDYPKFGNQSIIHHRFEVDDFDHLLNALYLLNIGKLLVEGGSQILQIFIDKNAFDEIIVIKSKKELISGKKAPIINLLPYKSESINNDLWLFH